MNQGSATRLLTDEELKQELQRRLFPQRFDEEEVNTFVVLDGASNEDLLDHLYDDPRPDFACLYRGELEPDMAEVAPYLVQLQPDTAFTDWLLDEGWGKHWGVFALSHSNLKTMIRHFRKFLMVRDPEGKQLLFRLYDPRVLREFLPPCNAQELAYLFGALIGYICEGEKQDSMMVYSMDGDGLKTKRIGGDGD